MSVIDDFLENTPKPQRVVIEHIRSTIRQLVPESEETISYAVPVYKYKGKYLIGLAPFSNHMSIFPGGGPVHLLADKLTGFKTSTGTIQFTVEKPLPDDLLKEIILLCKARID